MLVKRFIKIIKSKGYQKLFFHSLRTPVFLKNHHQFITQYYFTSKMQPNPPAAEPKKEEVPEGAQKPEMSKKALKKLQNKKKKAEKKAQFKAQNAKTVQQSQAGQVKDVSQGKYGDLPTVMSQIPHQDRFARSFTFVGNIGANIQGQKLLIRARIHHSASQGGSAFVILRQRSFTIQACCFKSEKISKQMIKFIASVPTESYVEIQGTVVIPKEKIESCTNGDVEIQIETFFVMTRSLPRLPFELDVASKKVLNQQQETKGEYEVQNQQAEEGDEKKEQQESKENKLCVKQKTRLDSRIIDLRVPTNQSIFRIQGGVCKLFRQYLDNNGFTQIHTPKLISGASQGGATVFKLKYFNQEACLAQSPQFFKQMAVCSDFERVYEIGPVFRAQNSKTKRHLCEFTMLDVEMQFGDHYYQVLDTIQQMFDHIFKGLNKHYGRDLEQVNKQYPFQPFKWVKPCPRLDFKKGCEMLKEAGYNQDPLEDLGTEQERKLGQLVRKEYGTDFYMLVGYPKAARPFYTMEDPKDSRYTNSYDIFMRGEQIISGAQRVHIPQILEENAKEKGMNVQLIKDYIDGFRYGAPPHGGCGIGLERIVKLFIGIKDIRKCCLFPRDPKRLAP